MRVYCPVCGHVSRICTRTKLSAILSNLYCICNNPMCAHSFVMDLAYNHTLSPSAYDLPKDIRDKLPKTKSRRQIQRLFEGIAWQGPRNAGPFLHQQEAPGRGTSYA